MPNAHLKKASNLIWQYFSRIKAHLDLTIIQKNLDLIAKILSSIFQIILIIILGSFLAMLANSILTVQEGITILPFDTSGMGEECSGKAVADRLGMEMQEIRGIQEYKQRLINSINNTTQIDLVEYTQSIPSIPSIPSIGKPKPSTILAAPQSKPSFPAIFSEAQTMKRSLLDIGNADIGPASVSFGQLLWTLRSIAGRKDKSITGSLETYGSNISIVAIMEDKNTTKGTLAWEVTMPIESSNLSNKDAVPSLIRNLAYNIFYDIQDDSGVIGSPDSWISFKYVAEGWNAFRSYNITNNPRYLENAEEMMKNSLKEDPDNIESAQLLVILQSTYQEIGDLDRLNDLVDMATQIPVLSGKAWFDKGVLATYSGNWREAEEAFDNAIEADPKNKLYWVSKSFALNRFMDKAALTAAEEAIKLDQNYADAWHEKGNALYNLGDFENSSEAHEKSIELDSNKWWYYYDHALPLGAMGVEEDCDKCYAEAIENLDAALGFDLSDSDRKDIIALKEGILAESQFSG